MKTLPKKIKKHVVVFGKRMAYAFRNLTVHGPSFLVRKDVHYIYRLIYLVIYINVWYAAVATIKRYYSHYHENTIRFTTRTDYLHWNTTFASVTVCETVNFDKFAKTAIQEKDGFDRFLREIAFYTGTCYSCLAECDQKPLNPICSMNHTKIVSDYRTPCQDFFISCKWNEKPIICCKRFKPIQTEYGVCYSLNNRHVKGKQSVYSVSTTKNQEGTLEIHASQDFEAFLHSPEDIPFWNMEYDHRIAIVYGSESTLTFSIMEVVNEPEVLLTAPEIRQCRFPHEVPEGYHYKHYSYSVCIVECRIQAQLHLCNCTHHLSPATYKDLYCNLEGLKCLTRNYRMLSKLKVPGMNETGLVCNCLPSCTEPDYNIVSKKLDEPQYNLQAGRAVFTLCDRPYHRVTRQVARTSLDLVVAIGNCFGLCFGGSLLSIVEFVYYLCLKRWRYRDKM